MARDTKELTDTQAALRRTAEMAAVFMIGDGLLGLLQPERHVALIPASRERVRSGRKSVFGMRVCVCG